MLQCESNLLLSTAGWTSCFIQQRQEHMKKRGVEKCEAGLQSRTQQKDVTNKKELILFLSTPE